MIPTIYRVSQRQQETADTFSFTLVPQAADLTPADFLPGQFNMLYPFGAGEVPISLSGGGDRSYIHTVRALGLTTQALEKLKVGDTIGLRGPFGTGWPFDKIANKQALVIAGGLGLAPLRPLIRALLARNGSAPKMQLFYGARSPKDILFPQELDQWQQQAQVQITVDHAPPEQPWRGAIGVVTQPLQKAQFEPNNTIAFLCGPEVMMRFCLKTLLEKGLPPEAIYLSMERNMKCATGHCGHCQWGPFFLCKDGPVFCYRDIKDWLKIRGL